MRRAGQKRSVAVVATSATLPLANRNGVSVADTLADDTLVPEIDERDAADRALEVAIHQRIETRLCGRVRELHVRVFKNVVVLEGRCATYYTKQLAQHAAMGIIEDEHLENAIVVRCSSEAW